MRQLSCLLCGGLFSTNTSRSKYCSKLECRKKMRYNAHLRSKARNPEIYKIRSKKYYLANKDRIADNERLRISRNPQLYSAKSKEYHSTHKAESRQYYFNNRDRIIAQNL